MDAILSHFEEPIEWSDPELALDTAGAALRSLGADAASLRAAINGLDLERLDAGRGGGGAYWFELAASLGDDLAVWMRYCPTGCVATAHTHRSEMLAFVLAGTFKQTLIGVGGGVDSPARPIHLFVRHERPGQVFALGPGQAHETSSTAGSMLLVATPSGERTPLLADRDGELRSKSVVAIARLQRCAREVFEGVPA